jgi:ferricrocin synthase
MRTILADFTRTNTEGINLETTIYQLGIDSISAIQLASELREQKKIKITATDILRHDSLRKLAQLVGSGITTGETNGHEPHHPGLSGIHSEPNLDPQACRMSAFKASRPEELKFNHNKAVEAVWPCTPLQLGLLYKFFETNSLYVNAMTYQLPLDVDVDIARSAWKKVISQHSMLRTGFAETQHSGSNFAMLVYSADEWPAPVTTSRSEALGLEDWRKSCAQKFSSSIHAPPWCVQLEERPGGTLMHLAMLHALFDAQSLRIFLIDFVAATKDREIISIPSIEPALSFILESSYPSDTRKQGRRQLFWSKQLDGANASRFPNITPLRTEFGAIKSSTIPSSHLLENLESGCRAAGFTLHAAGQAAWARLLSSYTGEPVVAFGTVLSGRDGLRNADTIAFPCLTTVPTIVYCNGSNRDVVDSLVWYNTHVKDHQFTPLAAIQRPNEPLFDTIFALQKLPKSLETPLIAIEEISTAEVGLRPAAEIVICHANY